MKLDFDEFVMKKSDSGEYIPVRTILAGNSIIVDFHKYFTESDDLFKEDSKVRRLLINIFTLTDDSMIEHITDCFMCLDKHISSKYVENLNGDHFIIGLLLVSAYRRYSGLLTSAGFEVPQYVHLVGSDANFYNTIVVPVENGIDISEENVDMVFGKYKANKRISVKAQARNLILNTLFKLVDWKHDAVITGINKQLVSLTKEVSKKETAVNNLKKKQEALSHKLEKANKSKDVVVKTVEVDTYKQLFEDERLNSFELEKKIIRLEERLSYIEESISDKAKLEEDIESTIEERATKAESYDFSKYKIAVVASRFRYISDEFKLIDLDDRPRTISACDGMDFVVIMSSCVSHSAYYKAKGYCKNCGIKVVYCSDSSNNMTTMNNAIKQAILKSLD